MPIPYLVVFAHARSGSNYLLDLFDGLEGVISLGELFNTRTTTHGAQFHEQMLEPFGGDRAAFNKAKHIDPVPLLDFCNDIPGGKIAVVKVLGHQLSMPHAYRKLIVNSAGVIHLRRNPFASWTSRALVRHSHAWHSSRTDDFSVKFDPNSFIRISLKYLRTARSTNKLVREIGIPSVTLSYSELVSIESPQALWNRVSSSIRDLPDLTQQSGWTPKIKRQDERLPIDRISNRADAEQFLEQHGLRYLLNNNDSEDLDYVLSVIEPMAASAARKKKRKPRKGGIAAWLRSR